ncbi:MAG: choice-of-anchor B family protein [Aureispira sp.]|nr:choice-of-anchor B family protein [Aureispira sp.]
MKENNLQWLWIFLLLFSWNMKAQTPSDFNFTPVGNLSYTQNLNDVWGYVDATGVEYALVGTLTGTSIVSLANPSNPVEVLFIPGASSTWRDVKTWGTYAYVTCDQGSTKDGLLIIDLSPLPSANPTYNFWRPELTINGSTDTLNTAHNLFIDKNGYCYVAGSNISTGEPFILDLNADPALPVYMGAVLPIYAHDVYTRGDTLWTSDIYAGTFSVYDVSNKATPVFLADQTTPRSFCHNAWISDDGNTLYTTDEKADAWVAAYDVSDLSNIQEIDRWKTPTPGTIPHNTHVLNDYLIVSYYTDGIIVLDGSHPDNLIEVGRYDSYNLSPSIGFNGAWGAYPYLPSGLILVSDMQTGLHVLQPNYQRGCRLEGVVTETGSGSLLFGVDIELSTAIVQNTDSDLFGNYKTGTGTAGTYNVTFKKPGYISKTIQATLVNGQVTVANVTLDLAVAFNLSGRVVESANTSTGVANAKIKLKSSMYNYTTIADANGNFNISIFPDDNYTIYAGKWKHHTNFQGNVNAMDSTNLPTVLIPLDEGYRDEFVLDLGWTIDGNATSGIWERGKPNQLYNFNNPILPEGDMLGDIGEECYITGNIGGGVFGPDNVDGETILKSPIFDLTTYTDPQLSYHFYMHQPWPPIQEVVFEATITNGVTTVQLDQAPSSYAWSPKKEFMVKDFITPTANMQVFFTVRDTSNLISEGGVDLFQIIDTSSIISPAPVLEDENFLVAIQPNPFTETVSIDYLLPKGSKSRTIPVQVYNALGQKLEQWEVEAASGHLEIGANWNTGIYFIAIENQLYKVLKQ